MRFIKIITQNFFVRLLIDIFLRIIKLLGKINTFIIMTVIYFSVIMLLGLYYKLQRWVKNLQKNKSDSFFLTYEN